MKSRLGVWGAGVRQALADGVAFLEHWRERKAPAPTADELERGALWIFPGINGGDWSLVEVRRGLRDGGVDLAMHTVRWGGWTSPFTHLTHLEGNRRHCVETALCIKQYHQKYPEAPIHLLGYSGGAGLALLTAEALANDVPVENIVLVHAAVSPTWDMRRALGHVRGRLVNVCARSDWFMLGLGTAVFGTIDRKHTASAGKNGFDMGRAVADEGLRGRVVQRAWEPEMLAVGHLGSHFTSLLYHYTRRFIAGYFNGRG